jgi:hypothetical protein
MYYYGKPGKTASVEVNCSPTVTSDEETKRALEELHARRTFTHLPETSRGRQM